MNEVTSSDGKRIDGGRLFWGVVLVGAGVLFLFDQMGIAGVHFEIGRFWPMFLVLLGLSRIFRRPASALSLIAIGTWLQLITLNIWGLTWESSWPMLLILFGVGMVLRALFDSTRGRRSNRINGGTP